MLISLFHMGLLRCHEARYAALLKIIAIVNKYRGFQKKAAENAPFWGGVLWGRDRRLLLANDVFGGGEGVRPARTFQPNECIKMFV